MLKLDFKKCHSFLIVIVVLFLNVDIQAQTFEHITSVAGLGILEENNGVAVADYDGDLDLDIFVVAINPDENNRGLTHSRLFRNDNNGSFTDVTAQAGFANLFLPEEVGFANSSLVGLDGFKYGAFWGDYDNDGYPDIFLTHYQKVHLFRNNADGSFTDVTVTSGISQNNDCSNTGAAWFDYNNDGFLDLFLADWNRCNGNTLYKNNGNGSFENVSSQIASGTSYASYTPFPLDINADGWQDIYVANDFDETNTLFINQNGTSFNENATDFGLNSFLDDMGIAIGDVNNDGYFDLFTTGIDKNSLFINQGGNTFTQQSETYNVFNSNWAWGCTFADFDLDGDEDLYVSNGFFFRGPASNFYYKNLLKEGQTGFSDVSEAMGLDHFGNGATVVDFDYDNDGDLDLIFSDAREAIQFYENKTLSPSSNTLSWSKIIVEGTTVNKNAFGTKIELTTEEETLIRWYNGVGMLSQSIKPIHFGLGQAQEIREIKVTWTNGQEEIFSNQSVNQHLKITQGNGIEVLNISASNKILGCTDPNACNYNPLAVSSDGNCVYFGANNTINGALESGFNSEEEYVYGIDTNTINWTVEGGEIVKGQGTNTVTIKWGIGVSGKITAIEQAENCISEVKEIDVALSVINIPENVSIARIWNEALLEAIRNDYARPTVHARNLFHASIALYDCWAIYDEIARPYLIGNTVGEFSSSLGDFIPSEDIKESQEKAMSYAAYRVLRHRFKNSPNREESLALFDYIMDELGFDVGDVDTDYTSGNAIALGNYVAEVIINYGNLDESREATAYDNAFYEPVNMALELNVSEENSNVVDANRWQPLTFNTFIDQSGNIIEGDTPEFLSPEWGKVSPFALSNEDITIFSRGGNDYKVFHDPGAPPLLDIENETASSDLYKWNFSLVSIWSAHLDPTDGVLWDISPKNIGNIDIASFPNSFDEYPNFYKEIEGGDISMGRSINPKTGEAYTSQMVPRADYARVLAEFWADGPDSETPPGHWFTILNYVSDHEQFQRRFNGEGEELAPLEWDIKSYFILAGAMHDAAITAWGIKGWYDYIRPISAIRYMSALGQSSDQSLSNYHIGGIPLKEGYVEVVNEGDELSGINNENVGEIKLFAWRGHKFIDNPSTDVAGVGWILAKDWFPYQRPSFVTPPFAGYLSGHSTYSRAAAEVLTLITGDEYFPGGIGEFVAKKDEFLVFEKGPSVDVVLQWATYRDASDQTSLSRIWGGIHPPADDILGRQIGAKVGVDAYNYAIPYFSSEEIIIPENNEKYILYPNPLINNEINIVNTNDNDRFELFDIIGRKLKIIEKNFDASTSITTVLMPKLAAGLYILKVNKEAFLVAKNN